MAWYRGALDERRVGRILSELGREWRVLHAVPQGEGATDIAHLVIGPPGVLAITSGVHSGIASAEAEARLASRSLTRATGSPIVAQAIIVAEEPTSLPASDSKVAVVSAGRLLRHLRALPAAFGPDLVASVARAAEEWTTWRPFSVDAAHTDPDDAFLHLHAEVTRARRRRTLWQSVGLVTLTAPVLVIVANLFF
ncbi:nuclease-related domain-containing protein [Pseudolysinimonas sp.]|uniref:nuclease-related domain-containing protein n=1 Tax=Pseudolysinimonas sp. TaxID=2680009 RepID=UPI0037833AF3